MRSDAPRYVTRRSNRSGTVRWYWQRKGFPITRLPDDIEQRAAAACDLNMMADRTLGGSSRRARKTKEDLDYWIKLFLGMKLRARNRKIPFTLTQDEFLNGIVVRAKGCCEVTGVPFVRDGIKVGMGNPYQPSIDRIDSSGNYEFENCRLVCLAVNVGLGKWGEYVYRHLAAGATKHAQMRRNPNESRFQNANEP
jgi:hypothetical protein